MSMQITITAHEGGRVEAVVNGHRCVYHCGDEAPALLREIGTTVSREGTAAVARRVRKAGAR